MPLTTLDPKTALIVIDLQKGIVGLPTAHPTGPVVSKSARLASTFRQAALPVVLVNVTGGAPGRAEQSRRLTDLPPDWADLVPELDRQPTDILISKRTWGAFMHTDLEAQLRALEVSQVVLTGIATSIGVESTARQAYELGFNVSFAIDAMTDLNAEAHVNSIERIFPRMGERGSTDELIAMLASSSR